MAQTARRLTYRGNPAFAPMLVQMLKEEGATVEWEEQPGEQRGLADMSQEVVVHLVATGGVTAVATAVAKFRKHVHGGAEATIENVEQDDDVSD